MEALFSDIRQAFRLLAKSPGFTAAALVALALGIGANTGIFSVVDKVLLQPLPYPQPDKIVRLGRKFASGEEGYSNSIPKVMTWRAEQNVFSSLAMYDQESPGLNLGGVDRPVQIKGVHVSADYFKVFGFAPWRGRTFTQAEDSPNGPKTAIISEHLWRTHFSADPNILQRTIVLNSEPYPVIGVMPATFVSTPAAEVWIPFQADTNSDNQGHYLAAAARLKDGVTLEQARAAMQLRGQAFRRANPKWMNEKEGVAVTLMRDSLVRDIKPALLILQGAVVVVLLIACANVANLLLARAAVRQRELSIRAAVGATRGRVIRQLLTESVILSGLGGILGFILGIMGVRSLLMLVPADIPRLPEPDSLQSVFSLVDGRIALFTLGVSIFTGILFGLMPALRISNPDVASTLKEASGRANTGSRHHSFVRKLLVASEMGLAVVLLISAMLLIRTFNGLSNVNSGIDPHRVLTMQTSLVGARYNTTEKMDQFITQVLRRAQALPGVDDAAAMIALPITNEIDLPFNIAGKNPKAGELYNGEEQWRSISPQYFATFKIAVLRGRPFNDRDTFSAGKVVIINQTMAKKYWKGENPVGQVMTIGKGLGPLEDVPRQIVGVVSDVRETGLGDKDVGVMYVPLSQQQQGLTSLANSVIPLSWAIRSNLDAKTLSTAMLKEIQAVDGQMPIAKIRTMEQVVSEGTARQSFNMLLLTIFAVIALLLAAIGIYGLMSYSVQQQTPELGVRMALGADRPDIFRLVVKQGMTPALLGMAGGLAAAFGVTRLLEKLLFGVKPYDPTSFATVVLVLSLVALLAVIVPARRAMGLDPLIALRQD